MTLTGPSGSLGASVNKSPANPNTLAGNSINAAMLLAVTVAINPGTSETGDCSSSKLGETPKNPRIVNSPVASPESLNTGDSSAATSTFLVTVSPVDVK